MTSLHVLFFTFVVISKERIGVDATIDNVNDVYDDIFFSRELRGVDDDASGSGSADLTSSPTSTPSTAPSVSSVSTTTTPPTSVPTFMPISSPVSSPASSTPTFLPTLVPTSETTLPITTTFLVSDNQSTSTTTAPTLIPTQVPTPNTTLASLRLTFDGDLDDLNEIVRLAFELQVIALLNTSATLANVDVTISESTVHVRLTHGSIVATALFIGDDVTNDDVEQIAEQLSNDEERSELPVLGMTYALIKVESVASPGSSPSSPLSSSSTLFLLSSTASVSTFSSGSTSLSSTLSTRRPSPSSAPTSFTIAANLESGSTHDDDIQTIAGFVALGGGVIFGGLALWGVCIAKEFATDHALINVNVALFGAHVILGIALLDIDMGDDTCAMMAGFSHLFVMAVFFWLGLYGVFVSMLKEFARFGRSFKITACYIAAWGLPCVTVILLLALSDHVYAASEFCYVSTNFTLFETEDAIEMTQHEPWKSLYVVLITTVGVFLISVVLLLSNHRCWCCRNSDDDRLDVDAGRVCGLLLPLLMLIFFAAEVGVAAFAAKLDVAWSYVEIGLIAVVVLLGVVVFVRRQRLKNKLRSTDLSFDVNSGSHNMTPQHLRATPNPTGTQFRRDTSVSLKLDGMIPGEEISSDRHPSFSTQPSMLLSNIGTANTKYNVSESEQTETEF
eukprot:m.67322 g.67322  ORF g.67322 m.67322 type:complete len:675 (+) comp23796_c0_seq1:253-2277(+)